MKSCISIWRMSERKEFNVRTPWLHNLSELHFQHSGSIRWTKLQIDSCHFYHRRFDQSKQFNFQITEIILLKYRSFYVKKKKRIHVHKYGTEISRLLRVTIVTFWRLTSQKKNSQKTCRCFEMSPVRSEDTHQASGETHLGGRPKTKNQPYESVSLRHDTRCDACVPRASESIFGG